MMSVMIMTVDYDWMDNGDHYEDDDMITQSRFFIIHISDHHIHHNDGDDLSSLSSIIDFDDQH